MTLSADILNQRSPYKLSQLGEFTFRFVTDQDIHYTVGFYKDTIFMDDGAYHFFIDNSEHEHGSYDPKILDVVSVILEEFFSQEPTSCSISVTPSLPVPLCFYIPCCLTILLAIIFPCPV